MSAAERIETPPPVLRGVLASDLIDVWGEIAPFIERLCARTKGRFRAIELVKAVRDRDIQLWSAVEDGRIVAIATTEIINYPGRRMLRFLATSGDDIERWIGNIAVIEEWAISMGCTGGEALARKGMERVMKPYGWLSTHVFLEREF